MNRFKTIIGIFLIFSCGVAAGGAGALFYVNLRVDHLTGSPPMLARLLMRPEIARDLNLSDAQRQKIMTISDRIEKNLQAFKQEHHPELIDILDNGMAEINELLDSNQKTRFARIHADMKHRWEKRCGPSGKAAPRFSRILCIATLTERLNLSEEQIRNIEPLIDALRQKYDQLRGPAPEPPHRPGRAPRAEIRALEEEAADRILPLLNPDQQQLLRSMLMESDRRARPRRPAN